MADSVTLQTHWELLVKLAEAGLYNAGKDVSIGGIIGTTLMLLETSNVGETLDLDAILCPEVLDFLQ